MGKQERRSCFFTFLDCGPILSEGPPGGGGRDADTHTHTYTYTYVSQSRVKTDLSQRSRGCVCMYVCMCMCMYVWNNAKMIKCYVLCPAVFLFRREEG